MKRKENSPVSVALSCGGFTLPEVLVAVAILATGIVVVLESFNVSLVALGATRNVLRSQMLIMDKMAEIELSGIKDGVLEVESANGLFGNENNDYHWESRVTDVSAPSGIGIDPGRLYQVDITVQRDGSTRTYSASTCFRFEKKQ